MLLRVQKKAFSKRNNMKIVQSIKNKNEQVARHQLIEELFYDFHKNRRQVYWTNFVRGIFFGLGTLLGGTIIVTIIIWSLGQFTGIFPETKDYVNQITNSIQQ